MTELLVVFLESTVRASMPLALAAVGETLCERAGFINIGLEGALIAGALAATVASIVAGPGAGYAAGAMAGAVTGMILVTFVIRLGANQVLAGTAVTAGALGLTAVLYRSTFGATGVALTVPMSEPLALPLLGAIPVLGPSLFRQPPITWFLVGLVAAMAWWLRHTRWGLAVRATGENPDAVIAAGMSPHRIQAACVITGSLLGGLGGAALVVAQAGTFAEGMTAGRGFIALAVVAVGRWHPVGVLGAAFLFGAASSLQYLLQATGSRLPYQLFLVLPYVLTLVVLAFGARHRSPAWLGRALP